MCFECLSLGGRSQIAGSSIALTHDEYTLLRIPHGVSTRKSEEPEVEAARFGHPHRDYTMTLYMIVIMVSASLIMIIIISSSSSSSSSGSSSSSSSLLCYSISYDSIVYYIII